MYANSRGDFERYGAVENILQASVGRAGGRVVSVPLPWPLEDSAHVLEGLDAVLHAQITSFI